MEAFISSTSIDALRWFIYITSRQFHSDVSETLRALYKAKTKKKKKKIAIGCVAHFTSSLQLFQWRPRLYENAFGYETIDSCGHHVPVVQPDKVWNKLQPQWDFLFYFKNRIYMNRLRQTGHFPGSLIQSHRQGGEIPARQQKANQ